MNFVYVEIRKNLATITFESELFIDSLMREVNNDIIFVCACEFPRLFYKEIEVGSCNCIRKSTIRLR